MSYYKTIFGQALMEIRLENEVAGLTYLDKFIQDCPSPVDCMSVEQSAEVHRDWCRLQGIDQGDFLMKMFAILDKTFPKRNCFMLQGQSNAGKTFWTMPCLPFPDLVGHTVQSQDFVFMKCLGKDIIQIPELTLSKNEQIEELKKVFEGLNTTVNIKNKEPRVLERTPVLLTCNQVPWRFFSEEQEALENRIFGYSNLTAAPMLEGKKAPSPKYYRRVFEYIRSNITNLPEYPCLPEDRDMWCVYTEMINDYVTGMINQKKINMEHLLESEDVQLKYLDRTLYLDEHPDHNVIMKRAEVRLECVDSQLLKEMYGWIYCLFSNHHDDYSFQYIHGKPTLMSQFSGGEYNGETDLDYQDYVNFRQGYTHLKRILLRLKSWPEEVDSDCTLDDILKCSIKKTVEYITKFFSEFLNENKDKCKALREAWEACEMDLPTKEEFAQGLKRVRPELEEILNDQPDGKRLKSIQRKISAAFAGVQLNCSSAEKSVILDCGPPSLEVPAEDMMMGEPIDPWKYNRPYNKYVMNKSATSSMEAQPPTPIDNPVLTPAEDLVASLKEDLLSFEEMYDIMASNNKDTTEVTDAESTTQPGDAEEPIVVD